MVDLIFSPILQMFLRRFANATRILLYESNRQKLENLEKKTK